MFLDFIVGMPHTEISVNSLIFVRHHILKKAIVDTCMSKSKKLLFWFFFKPPIYFSNRLYTTLVIMMFPIAHFKLSSGIIGS